MTAPIDSTPPIRQRRLLRGDAQEWEDVIKLDGVVTDVTSWVFEQQVRAYANSTVDDATVIATVTVELVDGPNGKIRRTLTAAESAKLPVGKVITDLQATDASLPAGGPLTFFQEIWTVKGDASQ